MSRPLSPSSPPTLMLDRHALRIKALRERENKVDFDAMQIRPTHYTPSLSAEQATLMDGLASHMVNCREHGGTAMMAFGAHTIKNALAPVLSSLMANGWLQHLATNGAGIIHDWEFAFQGFSSEDVRKQVHDGQFGIWNETGFNINLALVIGAWRGLGYGESVGAMVAEGGLELPTDERLAHDIAAAHQSAEAADQAGAAADVLGTMKRFQLPSGWYPIEHQRPEFGVQAAAYRMGIPFTGHPMIGHDIIYNHPMNHCAALGRCAQRDFLRFAYHVSQLEGGVYLSLGSAVMSPMIFEKSLAMAQNLALQSGKRISNFHLYIVDLAEATWDWSQGEPPSDNPAYYMRYCKTFSRMGGTMQYISMDNRDFLVALHQRLCDAS